MRKTLTALVLMLAPGLAMAGDGLMVEDAWIATAPPGVKAHAGYLEVHNHGTIDRILIGARVDGYKSTMLHESRMQDGIASMHHLDTVVIPAGAIVRFKPHGKHLMLMGAPGSRSEGESSALVLTFADGSEIASKLVVRKRDGGAMPAVHDPSDHAHGHAHHAAGHETE